MKKYSLRLYLYSILIGLLSASCLSDVDLVNFSKDVKLDESLVLPIGSANISVKDFLNTYGLPDNIDTTNTEISYLTSFPEEFTFGNLNFQDSIKSFEKTISLSEEDKFIPPGFQSPVMYFDANVSFDANTIGDNNRIDQILINSSLLNVQVNVSPDLAIIPASAVHISFIFDPQDLLIADPLPVVTPSAYGTDKLYSVGSYSFNLNGRNSIPFKIKVQVDPQPFLIKISSISEINLKFNFQTIDYKAAYGFFGLTYDYKKTYLIPIDLNAFVPNSHFKLANPIVNVTASTNVGADIDINIDYLKAYNSTTPNKVWNAMFYDQGTGIKSPSMYGLLRGPTGIYNWTYTDFNPFNKQNGEVDKFFDDLPYPDKIDYRVRLSANINRSVNFITPDNKINFTINARIPFEVKEGSYLNLQDTIQDVNIGTILDNVDSAVLVLKISNAFPLKSNYRMTYWKSNTPNDTVPGIINTIVDETKTANMTSEFQINAADVDANGTVKVDGVQPQKILIGLNKNDIIQLKQTRFIVFTLLLEGNKTTINGVETTNPIHLTTKNNFGVKLGVFVKSNAIVNLGTTR